jgi:hypothetical protein
VKPGEAVLAIDLQNHYVSYWDADDTSSESVPLMRAGDQVKDTV